MEKEEKRTPKTKLGEAFAAGVRSRQGDRGALLLDVATFASGFLFARAHLFFGARPFGLALVSALPKRVALAAAGAILGALSLGKSGIVFAMIAAVAALLRVIISGGGKEGEHPRTLFSETPLLRVSTALIGGFIAGVYEILLDGFGTATVLFGGVMMAAAGLSTFVLSGLFVPEIPPDLFFKGGKDLFSVTGADKHRTSRIVFFQIAALAASALSAYALSPYEFLGISFSYLFVGAATLFAAKRFGPLRAMALGFFSTLALSGTDAVAFAIAGLVAGLLWKIGTAYAAVGSIAALAAWSAYSGGLSGFLGTFPEYAVAALIAAPLFRTLVSETAAPRAEDHTKVAQDMVGTMTLAFRDRENGNLERLCRALSGIGPMVGKLAATDAAAMSAAIREKIFADVDICCKACGAGCRPSNDSLVLLADKLCRGEAITTSDLGLPQGCEGAGGLLEAILRDTVGTPPPRVPQDDPELFELFAKLLSEARAEDAREKSPAEVGQEKTADVFARTFPDGVIRLFGERRKYLICSGDDADGRRITDPALLSEIGDAVGAKFGTPEYYRRGNTVLMQVGADRRYAVECVTVSLPRGGEVSGDSTAAFESADRRFTAVLSDGMGSGEEARRTSGFVTDFLKKTSGTGASRGTLLYLLNTLIRRRGTECLATVDLFDLDLLTGDAAFYKSGAAPSYIRRGSSVFRIRSQTAPIGVLKNVDAERIKVEVKEDDLVIMLSDGVSQSAEDAPWLLELLSDGKSAPTPKDLADRILAAAREHNLHRDDITVTVAKITAA